MLRIVKKRRKTAQEIKQEQRHLDLLKFGVIINPKTLTDTVYRQVEVSK